MSSYEPVRLYIALMRILCAVFTYVRYTNQNTINILSAKIQSVGARSLQRAFKNIQSVQHINIPLAIIVRLCSVQFRFASVFPLKYNKIKF